MKNLHENFCVINAVYIDNIRMLYSVSQSPPPSCPSVRDYAGDSRDMVLFFSVLPNKRNSEI